MLLGPLLASLLNELSRNSLDGIHQSVPEKDMNGEEKASVARKPVVGTTPKQENGYVLI